MSLARRPDENRATRAFSGHIKASPAVKGPLLIAAGRGVIKKSARWSRFLSNLFHLAQNKGAHSSQRGEEPRGSFASLSATQADPALPRGGSGVEEQRVLEPRLFQSWSQTCAALLPTQGLGEPTRFLLLPPPRWPQRPSASCSVLLRSFSSFRVLRCPSPADFHLLSHWLGQKSLKKNPKHKYTYEEQWMGFILG